ncbi:multicopper oxidase domain-containing protein [Cryobacterium mannosilyticum]|uniref:multicopper oxidase domain-containing protein n=1 Tax=Cryobacterium mannosilyticum TaxID=1259190 RepID=UPI001F54689A|nr:multicopper oxidase domain-containing protein [Cryobacterium mannosilyticum]
MDDWLDGITGTPQEALDELSMGMNITGTKMSMKHMLMASHSSYLGGYAGDATCRPISSTAKQPVTPKSLLALPATAFACASSTQQATPPTGSAPDAAGLPTVLEGKVTDGGRLKGHESVLLPSRSPARGHTMRLTGTMAKYNWGINGRHFDMLNPFAGAFEVAANDRIRVKIINETKMLHPMHLHGHTFQIAGNGAREDTVIVRTNETVTFEFEADDPGQWLAHCHNAYHAGRGMMGVFSYVR